VQENDELLPESETDFFSTVSTDTYTFEKDGDGKVTAMILHAGGKDIPIKRID
jgi:hypothetical protein